MPVAKGRTTANKTITLPNGNTVLVPVITQLNVVDPVDRYQETDYTIINTFSDPTTNKPTHRQVHVDQIDETGNIDNSQPYPPGDSTRLPVERVDMWPVLDPVDRAQESNITLINDQANYDPSGPPFFTRHKASHVVRVLNDPDDGNYVDVELIDELDWVDAADRGQETHLQLNQPQGTYDSISGMYVINADPSDPDITDTSSGIDPPFRLDPFQNIVGYSGGGIYAIVYIFAIANPYYSATGEPLLADGSTAGLAPFNPTVTALEGTKVFDPSPYFVDVTTTPTHYGPYYYAQTAPFSDTVTQAGVIFNGAGNVPPALQWFADHYANSGNASLEEQYWLMVNQQSAPPKTIYPSGYPVTDAADFSTSTSPYGAASQVASYAVGPIDTSSGAGYLIVGQAYDIHTVTNGPWAQKTVYFSLTGGKYEKVAMVKLPSITAPSSHPVLQIDINAGYRCGMYIFLYPASSIKVDTGNTFVGETGSIPNATGKVYFPIAWNTDATGHDILPNAPNGNQWLGHRVMTPSGYDTNVVNAVMWWLDFSAGFSDAGGSLTFVLTKDAHFLQSPGPPINITDPNQTDSILQLYMSFATLGGSYFPSNLYWQIDEYCDLPFGTPFWNPEWGRDGFYDGSTEGIAGNGLYGPMVNIPFSDEVPY